MSARLVHQSLASLQHLDVCNNRIGNHGLTQLCAAVARHPTLTTWQLTWAVQYFDEPCTRSFAGVLRNNCVLTALPIDNLVPASPPALRYLLLDALKLNVSLVSPSTLLLPLPVRVACRRFAGLPCPAHVMERRAGDDAGGMLLDPRRLGPRDTWRQIGEGAFGQVFRTTLDGSCDVCVSRPSWRRRSSKNAARRFSASWR